MKILDTLKIDSSEPTAVAVGFFDGVHRGHRAVIDAALKYKSEGLKTVVFSFSMSSSSPAAKKGIKLLTTPTIKAQTLEAMDVDWLLLPDFSAFMGLSPEQFAVEGLFRGMNAKVVCCGYDYRFGKGASAGAEDLKRFLSPYGIKIEQIGAVLDDGKPISSTRIRGCLQDGNIEEANRLLGGPFAIDMPVEHGKKLGRKLGFPTANQRIAPIFAAPRFGVYATRVTIDGETYTAVTNVGVKPTVGSDFVGAESYILDWSGDLYGKNVKTEFLTFLRPEQKFESLDALREEVFRNAEQAREAVKNFKL